MTTRDLLLCESSLRATAGWHSAESDLYFRTRRYCMWTNDHMSEHSRLCTSLNYQFLSTTQQKVAVPRNKLHEATAVTASRSVLELRRHYKPAPHRLGLAGSSERLISLLSNSVQEISLEIRPSRIDYRYLRSRNYTYIPSK